MTATYGPGSLDHALAIREMGQTCIGQPWAVFPLRRKVPFAGSHGFCDATSDPKGIRGLWGRFPGGDGVGIATGVASGTWVLDVDVKDGHRGDDTLADLERQHGELPGTVQAVSGSGGLHYYFLYDPRVCGSRGKLGDGLDIRSDGGYIVAPGSLHPTGGTYEWESEHFPGEQRLVPASEWLVLLAQVASPSSATVVNGGVLATMVERMKADGWEELEPRYGRRRFARPGLPGKERATWYPPDQAWPEGRLTIFTSTLPEGDG